MKRFFTLAVVAICSSFAAFAGPYIDASPSVLNSFNYAFGGGPSESKVIVVQSAILAPSAGNITITCPGDYEVSLDNVNFSGGTNIPYTNDTLAPTNVYVRMKAGLGLGNYNGETISFTCPSASKTVTASGAVTSACIITTGAITATTASFTWSATGALAYECKADQAATDPVGSGAPASTTAYTANGLTGNTNYFFHVRGNCGNNNFTTWTTQAFSTIATGVINTQSSNFEISLLPNPSNGLFIVNGTLRNEISSPVNIEVVNAIGQTVYHTSLVVKQHSFTNPVDLSAFAGSGMYVVRVSVGSERFATRLSIIK